MPDNQGSSTRPYLIRALHDWCTDNGFTPYLAVFVDRSVQVPMEYVKNGEIVLNIGFEATSSLRMGNDFIEFRARFGGVPRDIVVPVDHVVAIYARENGQGMAFPMPVADTAPEPEAHQLSEPAEEMAPRTPALRLAQDTREASAPTVSPLKPIPGGGAGEEPPPAAPPTAPAGRPALKRVK